MLYKVFEIGGFETPEQCSLSCVIIRAVTSFVRSTVSDRFTARQTGSVSSNHVNRSGRESVACYGIPFITWNPSGRSNKETAAHSGTEYKAPVIVWKFGKENGMSRETRKCSINVFSFSYPSCSTAIVKANWL